MKKLILPLLTILFFSCQKEEKSLLQNFENSNWRGVLKIQENEIPFQFDIQKVDGNYEVVLKNGTEALIVKNVRVTADSIVFSGHIFDSEIRAKIINDSLLQGEFVRLDTKQPYSIPFEAKRGNQKRFFENPEKANYNFTGKWKTKFISETDTNIALGVFVQEENDIFGTFLTPTGDYRFLQGQVSDSTMYLSTFDGAHAYLFKAKATPDGVKGGFWSGSKWFETWTAEKNDTFELPDPNSITYLKEGFDAVSFSYTDSVGRKITMGKEFFEGKVTVLQILGSWCPNCMDESLFLRQLPGKYPTLQIYGLAFEKAKDLDRVKERLARVKTNLQINYPIIYMGEASTDVATEAFPMLNEVISFPTTIVIDKKGKVRKIHTGFNGPGTGKYYTKFTEDFTLFIEELERE